MNQSGKASFEQLLQHPGLLKHYVKEITDSLEENETVPCKPYHRMHQDEYLSSRTHSRSFHMHPQLSFLRRVNVTNALRDLKNMGIFPFQTSQESMPEGQGRINNFNQFKAIFHASYCYHEGLPRTSDMARLCLVYVFHGKCQRRQTKRGWKSSLIIFELRRQYMHGANNFAHSFKHFGKLLKYLKIVPAHCTIRLFNRQRNYSHSLRFVCKSGVPGGFIPRVSGGFISGVSGAFISGVSGAFISGVSGAFILGVCCR